MLDFYFSDDEIANIQRGVDTFNKMISLLSDPLHGRFIAEEQDLVAALESIRSAYASTERMLGTQKYQGVPYNAGEQVMKDMTSFLLTGRTESEDAYMRKRNLPMFVLVIEPTLNMMSQFNHEDALERVDVVIDELIELVNNSLTYGTLEDAIAARADVQQLISARELQKKMIRDAKHKPKKKTMKDHLIELLAEVLEEEGLE